MRLRNPLFESGNASHRLKTDRSNFNDYMCHAKSGEIDHLGNSLADHGGRFLTVKHCGTAVGMFGPEPEIRSRMLLRRFYVSPHMQGTGLARRMFTRAEVKAQGLGTNEMSLTTSSHQSRAIHLYQRMGFSMCPDLEQRHPLRCFSPDTVNFRGLKALST